MQTWISIGLMAFSTIASIAIAIYAFKSHDLAKEIKKANELKTKGDQEFREQVSDLYQAIVISNLIPIHSGAGADSVQHPSAIDFFKRVYKGKTPIHLIKE